MLVAAVPEGGRAALSPLVDAHAAACAPLFQVSIPVASATLLTPLLLEHAVGWELRVLMRSALPARGGALGSFTVIFVRAEFPVTATLLLWT